jgi:hypothetical protein
VTQVDEGGVKDTKGLNVLQWERKVASGSCHKRFDLWPSHFSNCNENLCAGRCCSSFCHSICDKISNIPIT